MSRLKLLASSSLEEVVRKHRQENHQIVTTNGCFDILHVGHLRYLQQAKQLGDILIVLINSDASIQRLKGSNRPILPEAERAELLAGLVCVDYVTIFEQDTPLEYLKQIRPDIHVKGGDYDISKLPESPLLQEMGTRLEFIPFVEGQSTSNIVERIATLHQVVG
jgi:rfaE bifunctional protein nucleotidyltransferase chain/domain